MCLDGMPSASTEGALAALREVTRVQLWPQLSGNCLSPYQVLLRSERPEALFARLYREARTPEGKAYALSGLFETHPQLFETYAAQFVAAGEQVELVGGCIGGVDDAGHFVQGIRNGAIRQELRDFPRGPIPWKGTLYAP